MYIALGVIALLPMVIAGLLWSAVKALNRAKVMFRKRFDWRWKMRLLPRSQNISTT